MIVYTPTDNFTDAEIHDLTDLVKGGITGDANVPLKALANRDLYLKNRLGRYEDMLVLNDTYTFDITTDLRKLLFFSISANKTLHLPLVSTVAEGTTITIVTDILGVKCLTVQGYGTVEQVVDARTGSTNTYHMHNGERVTLVAKSGAWYVSFSDGNFGRVGMEFYSRNTTINNAAILQGQLVNRADMPRLWEFAQSVGVIYDADWLASINNQGNFSMGNGTTTFRLPDERSMFTRALDLGRGIDTSGIGTNAGRYEADAVLLHDHVMHGKGLITGGGISGFLGRLFGGRYSGGGGDSFGNTNGGPDTTLRTGDSGGAENLVKNLAKYPLILY